MSIDIRSQQAIQNWAAENKEETKRIGILKLAGSSTDRHIEYVHFKDISFLEKIWISFQSFFQFGNYSLKSVARFIDSNLEHLSLDNSSIQLLNLKIHKHNASKLFKIQEISHLGKQNIHRNIRQTQDLEDSSLPTPQNPIKRLNDRAKSQEGLPQSAASKKLPYDLAEEVNKAQTHEQKAEAVFKHHNIDSQWGGMWRFFIVGHPDTSASIRGGYEDARRMWKVFLNPTRENFYIVLHRVIEAAKKEGISFDAKIACDVERKSGHKVPDDPCEPKLLLYVVAEEPKEAAEKLKKVIGMLEREFSKEEMSSLAHDVGKRQRDHEVVDQWGPSFTKKHTNLIFYSQGGFTESGRNVYLKQGRINEKFEGENYYLYKGTSDPLD